MFRSLAIGCVFLSVSLLTACQSDNNDCLPSELMNCASPSLEESATEVTVFKDWEEKTESAKEDVITLSEMAVVGEKTGELPSFFKKGQLTSREERDNIQHGYIYPLYFLDQTDTYPGRQWADGYTVNKDGASDAAEAEKMARIREEMIEFWSEETYRSFFRYLTNYPLIDVRHYSLIKNPPGISKTCFTVAFRTHKRGAVNYCYNSHRMLADDSGVFPQVEWDMNPGSTASLDDVEAFKVFVMAIASHEVIFANPDNRKLRDIFVSNKRLSAQMHEANDAFDGAFDYTVEGQQYLNGRQ